MSHDYNTKAKILRSTMSQEALAKSDENIINIINNLKEEV